MNANELADELCRLQKIYPLTIPFVLNDSANMIRQLQSKIEALKLRLHTTLTNRNLRTYDGKADFNKENPVKEVFNTEPVAWMAYDNSGASIKCTDEFCIPLYTHPAKTLTDEEIEDLADKYLSVNYKYGEDIYVLGEVEFARAILKKASEK